MVSIGIQRNKISIIKDDTKFHFSTGLPKNANKFPETLSVLTNKMKKHVLVIINARSKYDYKVVPDSARMEDNSMRYSDFLTALKMKIGHLEMEKLHLKQPENPIDTKGKYIDQISEQKNYHPVVDDNTNKTEFLKGTIPGTDITTIIMDYSKEPTDIIPTNSPPNPVADVVSTKLRTEPAVDAIPTNPPPNPVVDVAPTELLPDPVFFKSTEPYLNLSTLPIDIMKQMAHGSVWNYILRPYEEDFINIIPDIFASTQETLLLIRERIMTVYNYMWNMRKNLELVTKDLSMPQHDVDCPSSENNWIKPVWQQYAAEFSVQYQCLLHEVFELSDLPVQQQKSILNYFLKMEFYISLMRKSVDCCYSHTMESYKLWKHKFRIAFEGDFLCSSLPERGCQIHCFWKDGLCRKKPFMSVIKNIIAVYCDLPFTNPDNGVINSLYQRLRQTHFNWYGNMHFPEVFTLEQACGQIRNIIAQLESTIKSKLGVIDWHQAHELLNIPEIYEHDLWNGDKQERETAILLLQQNHPPSKELQLIQQLLYSAAEIRQSRIN
jgi:hypothetical protein